MATFDDKDVIDRMIANNGHYEGDPQVVQIVEYVNGWGNTAWGVTWADEPVARQRRYEEETEFVRSPRVIWRRDGSPGHYGQGKYESTRGIMEVEGAARDDASK